MSDSADTNNELDQYGVWVKTPPHDPQEEAPAGSEPDSAASGQEDEVEHPAEESSPSEQEDGEISQSPISIPNCIACVCPDSVKK